MAVPEDLQKLVERNSSYKNKVYFPPIYLMFIIIIISLSLNQVSAGKLWNKRGNNKELISNYNNDNNHNNNSTSSWENRKWSHSLTALSAPALRRVSSLTDQTMLKAFLEGILIPRIPGSKGHQKVKGFIVGIMEDLGWDVALDSFWSSTPIGDLRFSNIIASLPAESEEGSYLPPRRLALACHYDSKLMLDYNGDEKVFLAATDSAVPCALMLHLASTMNSALKAKRKQNKDVTLELIFFDGEEAFERWSKKDSTYGSRHLASKMASTPFPRKTSSTSRLDSLDALVLLDLLGEENPVFRDFFPETSKLFHGMAEIEEKMRQSGGLSCETCDSFFSKSPLIVGGVEDDHLPFLERGVPILHLIPTPFPKAWHRTSDDGTNLHPATIHDLSGILAAFVAEYLALDV